MIPTTDAEAEAELVALCTGPLRQTIAMLYEIRRMKGQNVLDAYEWALSALLRQAPAYCEACGKQAALCSCNER